MNLGQGENYANNGSLAFHAILTPALRICIHVLDNLANGDEMKNQADHLRLAWQIPIIAQSTQIVRYWQ